MAALPQAAVRAVEAIATAWRTLEWTVRVHPLGSGSRCNWCDGIGSPREVRHVETEENALTGRWTSLLCCAQQVSFRFDIAEG